MGAGSTILFALCTAYFVSYARCVVFRSAPVYGQSCNTACSPGISVRDACMVFAGNRGYTDLGYSYALYSGGPTLCLTGTGMANPNMTCLCAEHADDWRTRSLSTGNGTDCASACSKDGDSRNLNWAFSNLVFSTTTNVTQYAQGFCNISTTTWGMHYEQQVTNLTASGSGVLGGTVLQAWNGSSLCYVSAFQGQNSSDPTTSTYGNSTQCLCVRVQSPLDARFSAADDLANKGYTAGPLPDLTGRLQAPTPGPMPSSGNRVANGTSPGPALTPALTQSSAPQKGSNGTAAAIGGAIGGAAGALLIASLAVWLIRRRRKGDSIKSGRMGVGRHAPITNPWAPNKEQPFWRKLLPSTGGRSSRSIVDTYTGSNETGLSSLTLDATKSVPLSTLGAANHENYGLMKIKDLDLLTAKTAPADPAILGQKAEKAPRVQLYSEGVSRIGMTKDTAALVDSDLPPQLRKTWQINLDQLQLFLDRQQKPVALGKGAYGTVYLGILDGVRKVAVKVVDSPTQRHQQRFVHEIATLRACYDSNIVAFLGASLQEGKTLLVMEYMTNGNLWDNLQQDSQDEFRWFNGGRKIALDIAAGMSFLHRNDIVHLDLKSPNVLLDEHNKACIADIGLGKMLVGQDALASAATFFWAAPEQLQGLPVSKASDIFSLGVVIWEIITGEQPLHRTFREVRVPEECPSQIAEVLAACLSPSPATRPTINEVFTTLRDAPH